MSEYASNRKPVNLQVGRLSSFYLPCYCPKFTQQIALIIFWDYSYFALPSAAMTMRHFCFLLFVLFFASCAFDKTTESTPATTIINQLKSKYAPDKRVARWFVQDTLEQGQVVLRGETNLPEAKSDLLEQLQQKGVAYLDSIELLPSAQLAGKVYGLVNVSVANIRSEDKHWGEMASQVLLGTPLKIMKKVREGWFYVQSPDGYLGYMDQGALTLLDEAAFRSWQRSPKVVYWKDYGFSTLLPDANSQRISDLVIGALLRKGVSNDLHTEVIYPDGRTAFIPTRDLQSMEGWLDQASTQPDDLIATAKRFVGRPYLWGGTSGKGMDCSGFTKTVFYLHGMILQRDASQQVHTGTEVKTDSTLAGLQKGDFLFFGRITAEQKEKITHVGIYIGDGLFIHSGDDNPGIRIQSLKPGTPNFAPHRLASLLRTRRLWAEPGQHQVQLIKDSEFYFSPNLNQ